MATPEEITQQFQYAFNAKEDIKDAINEKGVEVTDSTPLGEYGNRVRQINQNPSPFDYSTGTDSAIQKSQDPNDANVADGYHAGAFGTSNSAPEDNSFAIGNGLTTGADNQTVVGQHNEVSNDSLFVVGNGVDAQNKSNAFEVKEDGTAVVGANPSSPMGVATKGYVDAGLSEKANPDGYYKEMTVGYSEQLLSTTGVETNDAFITRATAGEADVTSGPAQIRKIKGNTIRWNQLCTNGNFAGTTDWSVNSSTAITSFTASDNVATLEVASSGSIYTELRYAVIGHKYAMRYTIKSSVDNVRVGTNYGEGASSGIVNYFTIGTNWTICSRLLEATSTARYFYVYVNTAGTYNVKNAMLFDLTQMFGAGNEPTLDEFNAMFTDEYYVHNAGELISCKPSGMQTVGFNLCPCASIFEKTFTTYANAITGDDLTTVKNWLKSLQRYNQPLMWEIEKSYTPEDIQQAAGSIIIGNEVDNYMLTIVPGVQFSLANIDIDSVTRANFYARGNESITFSNACMHFVWSGARNGDYEPYQQNTLAIDTATHFPNGMRSAGTAYDEMDFVAHKATTRIGAVDLGGLNWVLSQDADHVFRTNLSQLTPAGKTYTYGEIINVICPGYRTNSTNHYYDPTIKDGELTALSDLKIRDDRYSDAESFKAAMNGVVAYYEIATPIEVSIPEYTPNIYQVDDYGTETWLQTNNPDTAAPVGSELFYYANLRDKLQHLPSLASGNGNYIIKQENSEMELIAGYSKAEIDAIVGSIDTALTAILYGTGGNS